MRPAGRVSAACLTPLPPPPTISPAHAQGLEEEKAVRHAGVHPDWRGVRILEPEQLPGEGAADEGEQQSKPRRSARLRKEA